MSGEYFLKIVNPHYTVTPIDCFKNKEIRLAPKMYFSSFLSSPSALPNGLSCLVYHTWPEKGRWFKDPPSPVRRIWKNINIRSLYTGKFQYLFDSIPIHFCLATKVYQLTQLILCCFIVTDFHIILVLSSHTRDFIALHCNYIEFTCLILWVVRFLRLGHCGVSISQYRVKDTVGA